MAFRYFLATYHAGGRYDYNMTGRRNDDGTVAQRRLPPSRAVRRHTDGAARCHAALRLGTALHGDGTHSLDLGSGLKAGPAHPSSRLE